MLKEKKKEYICAEILKVPVFGCNFAPRLFLMVYRPEMLGVVEEARLESV